MKITVTDQLTFIPAKSGRKQLIAVNTGDQTAYYGWELTTTATNDANQGVPLVPGGELHLAGRDIDISGRLGFICPEGQSTDINFTQRA